MKKLSLILTVACCIFLSINAKAQSSGDYFPGKWQVLVAGTPNGDVKMHFVIERKDGKLTGTLKDSTWTKDVAPLTQVDEKDKTVVLYFHAADYDLTLSLEPVDADDVKGSLLGMFDAKGVRVKQ